MTATQHILTYFGVFALAAVVGWGLLLRRATNGLLARDQVSTIIVSGFTGVLFALLCRTLMWHFFQMGGDWNEPIFEMVIMSLLAAFAEVKISEFSRMILRAITKGLLRAFNLQVKNDDDE